MNKVKSIAFLSKCSKESSSFSLCCSVTTAVKNDNFCTHVSAPVTCTPLGGHFDRSFIKMCLDIFDSNEEKFVDKE
jgi:hypothetical protein